MPVQAAYFHVLGRVPPFSKTPGDDREVCGADCHVEHVKPGEAEERAAKQRHTPRIAPGRHTFAEQSEPFGGMDQHERDSANDCSDQVADCFFAITLEGGIHAQDHGQAAGQQDEGHQ